MSAKIQLGKRLGGIFGVIVLLLGILNLLRGNDPGLGIMYILLSLIYFPLVNTILRDLFNIRISYILKTILAILIIWMNLEVGAIAEGFYSEIF